MNEKLQRFLSLFKRRNKYASPYYGTSGALFHGSAVPLRADAEPKASHLPEPSQLPVPVPKRIVPHHPEIDWEARHFELFKMLLAQERRSVVLGKLQASHKQIANTSRTLADASIKELQKHPYHAYEEDNERRDGDDESGHPQPQTRC